MTSNVRTVLIHLWKPREQHPNHGDKNYFFYCLCGVQVDLYEVLDSRVKPWRGNLITSRLVPLYTQGWEVFNVTQTVI